MSEFFHQYFDFTHGGHFSEVLEGFFKTSYSSPSPSSWPCSGA